jgi:hypothetical protein
LKIVGACNVKLILSVVLFFTGTARTTAAESPDWLTFPAGLDFDLTEDDGLSSVRIPVRTVEPGVPIGEISAVIRDVAFEGKRPESLARLLTVNLDPGQQADAARGPSIVLTAKDTLVAPGTYVILIDLVRREVNPQAQAQFQPITVRVTRPEPSLTVSSLLLVDQEYGFFHTTTRSSRLAVSETSGETSLTGVEISDVRDPVGAQPIDDGLLLVQLPGDSLDAGSSANAAVEVTGQFPLQTTAGSLHLRADQLKKPVVVNYQVRARRTPNWIWILTGAGFILGWLIRVSLKERRDWLDAQRVASMAVEEVRKAMATIPDTVVQSRLHQTLNDLQSAAAKLKPTAILDSVNAARLELKSVLEEFYGRRSAVIGQSDVLSSILRRNWQLPHHLMALLDNVREEAQHITDAIERQSVAEAQSRLDHLAFGEFVTLCNSLNQWRRNMSLYLAELNAHPLPQTEQGAKFLISAIDTWRAAFGADASALTLADVVQMTDALEKTHAARSAAIDLLNYIKGEIPKLKAWIDETLDAPMRPAIADSLEQLNRQNLDAAEALMSDLEQPEGAASDVAARQLRLRRDWELLLQKMIPGTSDVPGIRDALNNDQWWLAVQRTADLLPNVRGGRSLPFDELTAASTSDAGSLPVFFRTAFAAMEERVVLRSAGMPRLEGSLAEQNRFERDSQLASCIQTLFFAALFLLVTRVLSSDQWIGTSSEMLGMFAWAFGVDITSDAVMTAAKKLIPAK